MTSYSALVPELSWFLLAARNTTRSWTVVVDGQGLGATGTGCRTGLIVEATFSASLCIEQRSGSWQSKNESSGFNSNFTTQSWSKQCDFPYSSIPHLRNLDPIRYVARKLGEVWTWKAKRGAPNMGPVLLFASLWMLVFIFLLGRWISSLLLLETRELVMFRWYRVLKAAWFHG